MRFVYSMWDDLELMIGLNAFATALKMNTITTLNWLNFKNWKDDAEDVLRCMDLDMELEEDEIPKPNEDRSTKEMTFFF